MSDLLNSASLVMIPSGYKEDIVYSAVPTDGSGDLSFTRSSNGTRINSAGLVEVTPWNLLQESETFISGWTNASGSSVTANTTTAPNGTTTADTFSVATINYSTLYRGISLSLGIYTQSIYAKKGTKNWLYILDLNGASARAWFDLDTGVVGTVASGFTATIESVGNGWYRCVLTQNTNNTPVYFQFGLSDADNTTQPSSTGTAFIWGAQVNIGATAKPYFPTTDRLNVPRLTYQNGGGGCPSLLLEKQSTNLALQSQSFTSPWAIASDAGTNPVITQNYGISPDGTQNAVRIQLARTNINSSYSQVYQYPINITSGQPYTWSVYLKSLSGTPTISIIGDFGRPPVTLTSEWVRYTGTATAGSSQTQLEIAILGSNYATGNSLTADFLAWGYQFEASSYPTSYIPTTSASATRVADACSKTGISSLIGTDFTIFFDGIESIGGEYSRYIVLKGTGGAYVNYIALEGAPNNTISANVNSGGGASVFSSISGSFTNGQRIKMALRCKNNDFAFYINGALIGSQASGSVPTTADLYLGYYVDYTDNYNKVNQVAIFNTGLSNADLIALTTI